MKASTKGALMASAVALMFMANNVWAQDAGSQAGSSAASSGEAKVKCVGANDCKGKGACKGAEHDCKGQNACKGKGFIRASTTDECQGKGGHPES